MVRNRILSASVCLIFLAGCGAGEKNESQVQEKIPDKQEQEKAPVSSGAEKPNMQRPVGRKGAAQDAARDLHKRR